MAPDCSQSSGVSADRATQLENRIARLEEYLKSTTAGREIMGSRVIALEEQVRAKSKRARLIEQERDVLAAQVRAKVAEKEMAVAQYDDLLKKLETFLGHAKVTQANLRGDAKVQATVASLQK